MKALIAVNGFLLISLFGAVLWLVREDFPPALMISALFIAAALIASGSWTAYLYYKRGKVYEERGESGPDD